MKRKPSRKASPAQFFLDAVGDALGSTPISLEAIVEASSDAILFIDRELRIRFWSRGAEDMFGYTREEATGAYYDLLLPQDLKESDELAMLHRVTVEQGVLRNYVTRRVTKDGRERTISLSRTPMKDERGAVVGWTAILRDISEQARVEDELSRAKSLAMLGELAATVAHEIKNPLAAIYGATQILVSETPADDPRREVLERVADHIRRLDATVRDLLRFARPEVPKRASVDLRERIVSLAAALADDARFAGVRVVPSGAGELRADVDQRLLDQVFENLLQNACDAMEGRGEIHLRFERDGGDAIVRVRDTGPGIPEAHLERVFAPFFSTKPRGTGLGLAICRKNVEAHGGRITASNDPAGGAAFVVRLPVSENRSPGTSRRPPAARG